MVRVIDSLKLHYRHNESVMVAQYLFAGISLLSVKPTFVFQLI